jgi:hypothetical protein
MGHPSLRWPEINVSSQEVKEMDFNHTVSLGCFRGSVDGVLSESVDDGLGCRTPDRDSDVLTCENIMFVPLSTHARSINCRWCGSRPEMSMPGCKGYEMGAVLAATHTNVLVWRDVFIRKIEVVHIRGTVVLVSPPASLNRAKCFKLSCVIDLCYAMFGVWRVCCGVLCNVCMGLVLAIAQPTYIPMALHILKAYIIILDIQRSHDGTQDTNRTHGIFTVIQVCTPWLLRVFFFAI